MPAGLEEHGRVYAVERRRVDGLEFGAVLDNRLLFSATGSRGSRRLRLGEEGELCRTSWVGLNQIGSCVRTVLTE